MAISVTRLSLIVIIVITFMFTVPIVPAQVYTQPTYGCVIYRTYPNGTIYDVHQCPPQVVAATFESPIMALNPNIVGIGYQVNYLTGGGFSYAFSIGIQLFLYIIALIFVIFFRRSKSDRAQKVMEAPTEPIPET